MADGFSLQRIDDAVRGTLFHGKLHHFPTIDSTNTRAVADAAAGAEPGQVYIADEQTAGRGRGGHTWHSEPDRGLYLTALVRPALPAEAALKLSLAVGIAASLALLQVTGYRIDLRWPNDLLAAPLVGRGRKLGGILTESASGADGRLRYAAIGIGINLNQVDFPPELATEATSLRREAGCTVSREDTAIALLQHLQDELDSLVRDGGGLEVLRRFAALSSWVSGKQVRVAEGDGYTGVTAGLTVDGLLRVRCDDGSERVVRHGGVREIEGI